LTNDAPRLTATAVVATRDRGQFLEQVIGSLGRAVAGLSGAELIIVQQGRGDVEAVCRRAGVTARVVTDDGVGASRARNLGWRAAGGDVVAFTDDDCVVPPRWLVDHVHALTEAGVVVSCGQVSGLSRYGGAATEADDPTAMGARHGFGVPPWAIGHGSNLAVRRDALGEVGGFDERLGPGARRVRAGEDADLLVRLLTIGDARTAVGEPVRHLDWRTDADHARTLVEYELGAGAWIGKLAVTNLRVGVALLKARGRLLRTSSPWRDRRRALVHRAALLRGVGYGLLLGARPTHRRTSLRA
jgi:glycosyltransferase involved in cell wall biosynthesis